MPGPLSFNPTPWVDGPSGNTQITAARLNNDGSGILASINAINALMLNTQVVKTSAYTALVSDLVPVNAVGGAIIITLPTAPADQSHVAVEKTDASANSVTITVGGSDTINGTGTTLALVGQYQFFILQYSNAAATWYEVSAGLSLNQLDSRYIRRSIVPVTSAITLANATGQDVVALVGAGGVPTLPTAVSNGNKYTVKNIDSVSHTLSTTSSQTIDGAATLTIAFGASYDLISDGANWRVI